MEMYQGLPDVLEFEFELCVMLPNDTLSQYAHSISCMTEADGSVVKTVILLT